MSEVEQVEVLSGSAKQANCPTDRSWKRVWRQLAFVPLSARWLNSAAQIRLEAAIKAAEANHLGEIVLVVENTLPVFSSLNQTPRNRALELFSQQRVWDTERNSGVLIYLCLSEHRVELVVDRGLNKVIESQYWQAICDKTLSGIGRGEPVLAVERLIEHVGKALLLFDRSGQDPDGNELSDRIVRL